MDKYFTNIGFKIKKIAKATFVVDVIISIILGFSIMCLGGAFLLLGLFIIPVIILFGWIGECFLYGFGELIEKTSNIEQKLCNKSDDHFTDVSKEKLEWLYSKGYITEKEYLKSSEK